MASKYPNNSLENFTPFHAPANAEKLKAAANKELGETEEIKEECLIQLRKLIKDNNVACISRDDFLLRFLRIKKFDVQRSFQMLQNYAKLRVALQDLLVKLQPETVKTFLRHKIFGILPYRDAEERLITFGVPGAWKPSICSDEEMLMTVLLIMNYAAEEESSQITGIGSIAHASNIRLAYLPYALRHVKTTTSNLFNGLPLRYPAVHYLNEPLLVKFLLRLIRPFVPKKMRDRMLFYGESRETLFQYFAPCILPTEFGGSLGPLSCDHLTEELLDFLEKMKDEQKYFLG